MVEAAQQPKRRKRIAMVHPKFPPSFWSFGFIKEIGGFKTVMPPLGLATLAALTPEEYDVVIVDENIEEIDLVNHLDPASEEIFLHLRILRQIDGKLFTCDLPLATGPARRLGFPKNLVRFLDLCLELGEVPANSEPILQPAALGIELKAVLHQEF